MEETITLASGCFWCTEAVFKRLKGVSKVTSGYANSKIENPSYEEVCSGMTGAAEALRITFDPQVIPLSKIMEVFFGTHDYTTLNRQGNDTGEQYRSGIYFSNEEQEKIANQAKPKEAVTEILKLENFYPAENYHQNFYENNRNYPYCRLIIDPKITKLLAEFKEEVIING